MTSSSCFKRSKKIAERMLELENEVKEFHNNSGEIIKICSALVQKMKDVGNVEAFLEEYATTYSYLSSCAASFSEFNCKMEILCLGMDVMTPFLTITFPAKTQSDVSTIAGENRHEKSRSDDFSYVSEPVKDVRSSQTDENPMALDVKREDLAEGATNSCSEESFSRAQHTELSVSRNQTSQTAGRCNLEDGTRAEFTRKSNQSEISPTLPQPSGPASTLPVAITTSARCVRCGTAEVSQEAPVQFREPAYQCKDVTVEVDSRNGERREFAKEDCRTSKEEKANVKRETGKDFRQLKIDREVGVVHDVFLSHLVSPDEFYVFVKCEELMLFDELKLKLNRTMAKVGNRGSIYGNPSLEPFAMKRAAEKVLGTYALGFSDELSSWTRIKVLDWRMEENDDLIHVFYVDHGASGLLKLGQTAPMIATVADYPMFIQKCYLSSIAAIGGEWSQEDKTVFEIFTESTEKKSHMRMEITEKDVDRDDGAIGVNLFLPESRVCINEKLIEYGVAVAKKCETGGNSSKKSEEIAATYLPVYSVGESIPVKVTCIMQVNHIFCVKDYEETEETDVLLNLITYLNNPETESVLTPLEKPPSEGEFVIGKYEDGLWYRAQVVKSNPESGMCRVIFVDYGNTETVSMKEMRKMESKYLKIPFQMVECLLEGVEPKWKADPDEAVKYLNERVAEHTTINIRRVLNGRTSFYSVKIFDKYGEDIGAQLISAGYAASRNNDG